MQKYAHQIKEVNVDNDLLEDFKQQQDNVPQNVYNEEPHGDEEPTISV